MNGSLVPLVAVLGGGALLYLGVRRARKQREADSRSPSPFVYCDLRSDAPCGPNRECIPLYDEGQAPVGFENSGMCSEGVP